MTNTDASKSGKPEPWGKLVLVEFEQGIAWVTMNRPEKKNAISLSLAQEMVEVVDALETDDRCNVLVLTGVGDIFSAGMDLKDYFQATDHLSEIERMRAYRVNGTWQWRRLLYYAKPTIAMVNGGCFGGAFTPVIACDLAIAAEEAIFGLSEINWGIMPAGLVSKAVSTVMNQRDALYYVMTGDTFGGAKAASMGLVNEAVPRAGLRERTREVARKLLEKNPTALRASKVAYKLSTEMTWEQAAEYLAAKSDQLQFVDPEKGRAKGMQQFLKDKSYRPGLGAYRREE
jgi:trans-feruloyl-CoA hydratase/vanillin synthase